VNLDSTWLNFGLLPSGTGGQPPEPIRVVLAIYQPSSERILTESTVLPETVNFRLGSIEIKGVHTHARRRVSLSPNGFRSLCRDRYSQFRHV
jgi:hypothetical protein